jgi:adenylate cyclase
MSKATPSGDAGPTPSHRLESWKEIAVYLKRAVRTVRRWEKDEGLPVHRHLHKKLGTIYAHKDELDAWWKGRTGPSPPGTGSAPGHLEPSRLMVAILPFESLSADAGQDYFGEGLTQEVIVELGRTAPTRLGVIARTTSMHYKGARRTVRQIGAELGVDFVLEGSVRREAECVRVTAQLIQAKDQSHVWAGSYDQAIGSMLALQREIATDIARSISVSIPQPPVAPARPVTAIRPASYDAYIKGRHFLNDLTSESVQTGIECLRRSIALDPNNAPAHAALAEACAQWPLWADVPSVEMLGPAIEAAHIALGLDPNLADAHASLGLIHAYYVWDWSKAERDFERALELNPGCSQAGQWYSEFLAEMGRTDQALAIIDQAMRHDPLSLGLRSSRAFALWLGRRYD